MALLGVNQRESDVSLYAEQQHHMGHVVPATPACQQLLMRPSSAAWPRGTARGGGSGGGQPSERLASPEAFIQRLARYTQQAGGHALIAIGMPQRRGNQRVFGLFQGGEGLCGPRMLGGQRRGGPRLPG